MIWLSIRLFFAAAVGIEGVNQVALGLSGVSEETEPFFYLARLFSSENRQD